MKRIVLWTLVLMVLAGFTGWYVQSYRDAAEITPIERLTPLAEAGDAAAQYDLARQYYGEWKKIRSDSTDDNLTRAIKWYRAAAAQKHTGAFYQMGRLYDLGEGVSQDYAKAAKWYRAAVGIARDSLKNRDPARNDAQFALGRLYFSGRGVGHDYSKAMNWYARAANQGHAPAQYVMGSMYGAGWGVRRDPAEAYKWYTLSMAHRDQALAAGKDYDPLPARQKLAKTMSKLKIKRGEQRVEKWRDAHPE